jgi:DNA-binding winged helix-turn-helix (wHTH) protein
VEKSKEKFIKTVELDLRDEAQTVLVRTLPNQGHCIPQEVRWAI